MITERENYLRIYRGEKPYWVPRMGYASPGRAPAVGRGFVSPTGRNRTMGGGFDEWGVEYVGTKEMGGAALPVPGKFVVKDITRWREYLHPLDLSDVDWEEAAKKDLQFVDREQSVVQLGAGQGYFQSFVNLLGYTEALLALYEEPEACKEMLQFMSDYRMVVVENVLKYYKPDIWNINDDLATIDYPFISIETYREFFKPLHKREADAAKAAGCYIDFHCCGNSEIFIDDWLELGVRSWQPAQCSNDLKKLHEKYDDRLIFVGCWDSQGKAGTSYDEAEVKAFVKQCIEDNAKNGNFVFWGSCYGERDDVNFQNKVRWMQEAYDEYGRSYYGYKEEE